WLAYRSPTDRLIRHAALGLRSMPAVGRWSNCGCLSSRRFWAVRWPLECFPPSVRQGCRSPANRLNRCFRVISGKDGSSPEGWTSGPKGPLVHSFYICLRSHGLQQSQPPLPCLITGFLVLEVASGIF